MKQKHIIQALSLIQAHKNEKIQKLLPQVTSDWKSTVLSTVALDSKNRVKVLDEEKKRMYLGYKAWQLFFTEKHVQERMKGNGGCKHRWVQIPVRISFIALPCGNTTHLVEGSQRAGLRRLLFQVFIILLHGQ